MTGGQSFRAPSAPSPAFDPDCPFCPGHEAQLPAIIAETSWDTAPHWAVRVVPNKFPAVRGDANEQATTQGARPAYGFHEVLIESPRHNADLASMSDAQIATVVAAYSERSQALLASEAIEAVVLFRNHGFRGGASLVHPHAQIVAVPFVPPVPHRLAEWGSRHFREHGTCPTCDVIARERASAVRVVEETANFFVVVPFAAERPCEMWILPNQHQASFIHMAADCHSEFSSLLRRSLARLREARGDPPYDFVIDSAARANLAASYVHWRLRIAPTLATPGGFELGAGTPINPSSPESDAALLRECGAGSHGPVA
jgi:UDPglucose--hexose-1-phosphate uridylyltransferase